MRSLLVPRVVLPAYERLSGRRPWTEARRLCELQWRSPEELAQRTTRKLQAVVEHAYTHVPYYRALFQQAGVTPAEIHTIADLARLPISTKADLQANFPDGLAADNVPASRRLEWGTSGSSGQPFRFFRDRADRDGEDGSFLFFFQEWAGAALWLARYRITGPSRQDIREVPPRPAYLVRRAILGQDITHVDGAALTAADFLAWSSRLSRGRRYFIWGYASYVARLAARLREVPAASFTRPSAVMCSGETLLPADAATIEAAFGIAPTNHYSCWEAPHMAQTCPDNPALLHVNSERVVLRVVRADGSPAEPGEAGRVILTSLGSYVMPFINYDLGDWAVGGQPCPCGRGLPTLGRLEGRTVEVLRLPSGRDLTYVMFTRTLAAGFPVYGYVWQYQAEQTAPDALVLRVVPTPHYTADFGARLRAHLEDALSPGLRVTIETVDQIPAEPNGKHLVLKPYRGPMA